MKIKTADDVVKAIDAGYDAHAVEKARQYIGASIIGNQCDAYIALSLRGFPNNAVDPQLKRIFQLGHILEEIVVNDLKSRADIRVWEVDGMTGEQHNYSDWGGHVVCHTDGQIEFDDDVVRILEIKSMNLASFDKFVAKGVKRSHPHYYAQVQMMMGMSGMTETLFIAICKNNSKYHAELVEADPFEYAYIADRISRIMNGAKTRVTADPLDWRCSGCFKRSVCWDEVSVEPSCPTCANAIPRRDGTWRCQVTGLEAVHACVSYERFVVDDKT